MDLRLLCLYNHNKHHYMRQLFILIIIVIITASIRIILLHKIIHSCLIFFSFVFFFHLLASKRKKRKKKKKESKSYPICVFAHQKGEAIGFSFRTSNSLQSSQRIDLELGFFLFASLKIPSGRSNQAFGGFRRCMHMGGCVGCYRKPTISTKVDLQSKGSIKQGKAVKKPSTSEDFWTTSTHDMDNSAVQSQGSISSTSLTNQAVASHGGSCKTSNHAEFVNHGLILWNQTRQHWVGNKRSEIQTQQLREPKLSWNATYDSLLGSNKPFRQPIPLSEMVDFLVDVWEQEGLYD